MEPHGTAHARVALVASERAAVAMMLCMSTAIASCGSGAAAPERDASRGEADSAFESGDQGSQDSAFVPPEGGLTDAADDEPPVDSGGNITDAGVDASSCPGQSPPDGAPCSGGEQCLYLDCASYGRLAAGCNGKVWTLESAPCAEDAQTTPCTNEFGMQLTTSCAPGEICQIYYSGAVIVSCVKNTCPPGLLSCDCLDCGQGCGVSNFELVCQGNCKGCP
jgi:hypothetical protein